jgi:hypothetical protein
MPYSALTPSQQKEKLGNEATSMLTEMEGIKSSPALNAFDNFENLLNLSQPGILTAKKTAKQFQDVVSVSDNYGVFTWNPTLQVWEKTPSTTELKFIFPASENATSNNAVLSASSVASNIKIVIDDQTGKEMYLPSSATVSLTIGGTKVAGYEAHLVYAGGNPQPTEASYKLTFNGYAFENSIKRTTPVYFKASFTHNNKNLITFNVGSTADIDKLMEGSGLTKYYGTGNCLISLMDNFVMVTDMNIEGMANDENNMENTLPHPENWNSPNHFADVNTYEKAHAEAEAAAFNKNVKMALVSTKDQTKLADVIQRAQKGDSYNVYQTWNGSYWMYDPNSTIVVQHYDSVGYLKFNDNTEVAADVYFSEGFDTFMTKLQEFIGANP